MAKSTGFGYQKGPLEGRSQVSNPVRYRDEECRKAVEEFWGKEEQVLGVVGGSAAPIVVAYGLLCDEPRAAPPTTPLYAYHCSFWVRYGTALATGGTWLTILAILAFVGGFCGMLTFLSLWTDHVSYGDWSHGIGVP